MKILSIKNSKVFDYYISHDYAELLDKKYQEAIVSTTENDGESIIRVSIDYDSTIFGYLKMYLAKIQKITVGNMYLYEYELNCTATIGDKDFTITTNEKTVKCSMSDVYMAGPYSIVIIFKVI